MSAPFIFWVGDFLPSAQRTPEAPRLHHGRVVIAEGKVRPEVMVRDAMGDPSWRTATDEQRVDVMTAAILVVAKEML